MSSSMLKELSLPHGYAWHLHCEVGTEKSLNALLQPKTDTQPISMIDQFVLAAHLKVLH